jgi:hypothetical protein
VSDEQTGEQTTLLDEPEGEQINDPNDMFEVTVRVGDPMYTVGYAGRARVSGIDLKWTATLTADGVGVHPEPVEPATWDGETWTLVDGESIPPDTLQALMNGLAHTLQAVTNGAEIAATTAYSEAVTAAFGDIRTQRVMFL